MADVNTEKTSGEFVFGQNMEQRVVQSDDNESNEDNSDSSAAVSGSNVGSGGGSNLLRPSAFSGGSGAAVLAPSKFQAGANPWKTATMESERTEGKPSPFSSNPFAEVKSHHGVSTSDSEGDEKERPLVAPAHNFSSSRNLIASSKLAVGAGSPSKCLLRPSALDRQTQQLKPNTATPEASSVAKTSFRLEPAKLHSPFGLKKDTGQSNKENEADKASSDVASPNERLFGETSSGATSGASPSNTAEGTSSDEKKFVFGEKIGDRVMAGATSNASTSPQLVFGENLSSRTTTTNSALSPGQSNCEQSDGSTNAVNNATNSLADDDPSAAPAESASTQSLQESAAAEQAKHTKTVPEEVKVKTGEEDESNVFQLNAKLYAFEKDTQNWLERGRGILRLNDKSCDEDSSNAFQSRLVMRTIGSLRVIFNTKIWAGQTIERASQKSIRLSAFDGEDGIKVFLIMANPKDADQIFSALDWRVQQANVEEQKRKQSPTQVGSSNKTSPVSEASHKRRRDHDDITPTKKQKVEGEPRKVHLAEESNDSSTVDPETEASNESFTSSPTVKSTSSDN